MAQDLHAVFGPGPGNKHNATVDADGVALAAVQAWNQKVDVEVARLRMECTELKRHVANLEQLLISFAGSLNAVRR